MAYQEPSGSRLEQGEVLADVRSFSLREIREDDIPVGDMRTFSYAVIVTQDCDLEQDHTARFPQGGRDVAPDKLLFGVTLCGAYEDKLVKAGLHRGQAKKFGRSEWKAVIKNQDPRYQFLGFVPGAGKILVVDFKDYFMAPCGFLYNEVNSKNVSRVAQMDSPYKEHLLQRFAWYLMRVGLPVDFEYLEPPMPD